jgi:hypothetical protein
MLYCSLILVGIVLLAVVTLLRKAALGRRNIPSWAAFLVVGTALVGGFSCVARFDPDALGLPRSRPEPAPVREVLPEHSYPEGPLAAGENVPSWEAAGWLNGLPPEPGTPGIRLIVLDVWAHW